MIINLYVSISPSFLSFDIFAILIIGHECSQPDMTSRNIYNAMLYYTYSSCCAYLSVHH